MPPRVPLQPVDEPEHEVDLTTFSRDWRDDIERGVQALLGPAPPPDYAAGKKLANVDLRSPQSAVDIGTEATKAIVKGLPQAVMAAAQLYPNPANLAIAAATFLDAAGEHRDEAKAYLEAKFLGNPGQLQNFRKNIGEKMWKNLEDKAALIFLDVDTPLDRRTARGQMTVDNLYKDMNTVYYYETHPNKNFQQMAQDWRKRGSLSTDPVPEITIQISPELWNQNYGSEAARMYLANLVKKDPGKFREMTTPLHEGQHTLDATSNKAMEWYRNTTGEERWAQRQWEKAGGVETVGTGFPFDPDVIRRHPDLLRRVQQEMELAKITPAKREKLAGVDEHRKRAADYDPHTAIWAESAESYKSKGPYHVAGEYMTQKKAENVGRKHVPHIKEAAKAYDDARLEGLLSARDAEYSSRRDIKESMVRLQEKERALLEELKERAKKQERQKETVTKKVEETRDRINPLRHLKDPFSLIFNKEKK